MVAPDGLFFYKCFVISPDLDDHVSLDRFTFLIPEQRENENQTETIEQVYFAEIRNNDLEQVPYTFRTLYNPPIIYLLFQSKLVKT